MNFDSALYNPPTSPIENLPTELIIKIFSIGCELEINRDAFGNGPRQQYRFIQLTSLVCRRWREISLSASNPHFWYINLNIFDPSVISDLVMFKEKLTDCRRADLHIKIGVRSEVACRLALHQLSRLLPYTNCIRTMSMWFADDGLLPLFGIAQVFFDMDGPSKFSSLLVLRLHHQVRSTMQHENYSTNKTRFYFPTSTLPNSSSTFSVARASDLSYLNTTTDGWPFLSYPHRPPLPASLTNLLLIAHSSVRSESIKWEIVASVLEQLPQLRGFRLLWFTVSGLRGSDTSDRRRYRLPLLTELEVSCGSFEVITQLPLSALKKLQINSALESTEGLGRLFLPQLQQLALDYSTLTQLVSLLQLLDMPTGVLLRALEDEDTSFFDKNTPIRSIKHLELLTTQPQCLLESVSNVFNNLEEITLINHSTIDKVEDTLQAMSVEFRHVKTLKLIGFGTKLTGYLIQTIQAPSLTDLIIQPTDETSEKFRLPNSAPFSLLPSLIEAPLHFFESESVGDTPIFAAPTSLRTLTYVISPITREWGSVSSLDLGMKWLEPRGNGLAPAPLLEAFHIRFQENNDDNFPGRITHGGTPRWAPKGREWEDCAVKLLRAFAERRAAEGRPLREACVKFGDWVVEQVVPKNI